jgi:hypothetical protein
VNRAIDIKLDLSLEHIPLVDKRYSHVSPEKRRANPLQR